MVEAITKIKEAEALSEARTAKATEEAREIIRTAEVTARERVKAIRDDTRGKRAKMQSDARREAEMACIPLDKAAALDIERIEKPDKTAFNKAVDRLVKKLA